MSAVVLDSGSGTLKAGFAGEDGPRLILPSIVGRARHAGIMIGAAAQDAFVGPEADQRRTLLSVSRPIERGVVKNWDDLERLWGYAFEGLGVQRDDPRPVLASEPPLNPKSNREKTTELLFEAFNAPAVHIGVQAILALYAMGRTTGVVLELGDAVSQAVPIVEGFGLMHAGVRADLGGADVTDYLVTLLSERGFRLVSSSEREAARAIKEQLGFVALDFDAEMTVGEAEGKFLLPDGQLITVGDQRFRCCEALFRPSLIGRESAGVQNLLCSAITQCDVDLRRSLFANVFVSGGSSLCRGLPARLEKELVAAAPAGMEVALTAPEAREFAVWVGGSIAAAMDAPHMWIAREEFLEVGPSVVHRRCAV